MPCVLFRFVVPGANFAEAEPAPATLLVQVQSSRLRYLSCIYNELFIEILNQFALRNDANPHTAESCNWSISV